MACRAVAEARITCISARLRAYALRRGNLRRRFASAKVGVDTGIRTPVGGLKVLCPRPLDDTDKCRRLQRRSKDNTQQSANVKRHCRRVPWICGCLQIRARSQGVSLSYERMMVPARI